MNGTENSTVINWTETADGGWEAMIKGVTYLIERHGSMYYLYRGVEREQIDAHLSLYVLKGLAQYF